MARCRHVDGRSLVGAPLNGEQHRGTPRTRVFAVGSPFADDQAAWLAADQLVAERQADGRLAGGPPETGPVETGPVEAGPVEVDVLRLAQPMDMLEHLAGCRQVLILDACRGGAPSGSIVRLQWPDPRIQTTPFASTHALGLADALRLAECLGRLPSRVVILAIELSDAGCGFSASDVVRRAIPDLVGRVREELETLSGSFDDRTTDSDR